VPLVFAGLLVLAVLGVALYVIFSFIEVRVTDGPFAKTNLRWADRAVATTGRHMSLVTSSGRGSSRHWVIGLVLSLTARSRRSRPRSALPLIWKYQGIHAYVFWRRRRYFKAEGLDVDIDQAPGRPRP